LHGVEHWQRVALYRLSGSGLVEEAPELFRSWATEGAPTIAARPGGGIVIGASRWYHYESMSGGQDLDRGDTVVRERSAAGALSEQNVAHAGHTWNNAGGAMSSTSNSVWVAGGTWDAVFAARKSYAER
jgi:hypothetical protein